MTGAFATGAQNGTLMGMRVMQGILLEIRLSSRLHGLHRTLFWESSLKCIRKFPLNTNGQMKISV